MKKLSLWACGMIEIIRLLAFLHLLCWSATVRGGNDRNAAFGETDKAANAARRPVIAVCPLDNPATDPCVEHWRHAFSALLEGRLRSAVGLGVITWGELRPALNNAGWSLAHQVTPVLAERVGRDLALTHTVWGEISEGSGEWSLVLRISASGVSNMVTVLRITSPSIGELLARAPELVAESLDTQVSPLCAEGWRERSGPNWVWDALAEVVHLTRCQAPEARLLELLRKIVAEEPDFAPARADLLGHLLRGQDFLEAEAQAEELLRQTPDWCMRHLALGQVYMTRGNKPAAERHYREALQKHPGCPESCALLMSMLQADNRWAELREIFELALRESPERIAVIACLAHARLHSGDPQGAARLFESIGEIRGEEPFVYMALVQAVWGTAQFGVLARAVRGLQAVAEDDTRRFLDTGARSLVTADKQSSEPPMQRPRSYSPAAVAQVLQLVAAEDQVVLANPLEITPEISRLAAKLSAGLENPLTRAFAIFTEVAARGRGTGTGGIRTASQALRDLPTPNTRLSCQEYAKLFVTLARAAGLESWLVHVDVDLNGQAGFHDCAALFLTDRAFLVDPTWGQFVVHHQRYRLLNDLEAVAHQVMQGGDEDHDLVRRRAGLKLDPDDAWTRIRWAQALAETDHLDEAESELSKLRGYSRTRWDYNMVDAAISISRNRWKSAEAALQQALALAPNDPLAHAELAQVYAELDDLPKARAHSDKAARLDRSGTTTERTLDLRKYLEITALTEQSKSNDPGSREAVRRRAEAGDLAAQKALAQALFEAQPPQSEEGLKWLRKAAEHGDADAQQVYARTLLALRRAGAAGEAVRWYGEAAKHGQSEAQYRLALILYEGRLTARDPVAAWQWAMVAHKSGHTEAKALLDEMRLFLSPTQIEEGGRQAEGFRPAP